MSGRWVAGAEVTADVDLDYDVVVVGSGCGGATLALALAERGRKVLIVEQGGGWTQKDFDQRDDDMPAKLEEGRGSWWDESGSVRLHGGNNVGGVSVRNNGLAYRIPSDRLAEWEAEGLTGHAMPALIAAYERLERDHAVSPAGPELYNPLHQRLITASTSLGWRTEPALHARVGCIQSGHCGQGCAYDAKQSQLITHLPRATALGVDVYSDVRARRLISEGSRVVRLDADVVGRSTGRSAGPEVRVRARAFALAAGGVGSPAFLLRQGLGERLPQLGRAWFAGLSATAFGRFPEPTGQWRGVPVAAVVEEFRAARRDPAGAWLEGGFRLTAHQAHPGAMAAGLDADLATLRAWMGDFPRIGAVTAWLDDVERGQIEVDGDAVRVRPATGGENEARLRDAWGKLLRWLLAAGATEVRLPGPGPSATRYDEIAASISASRVGPGGSHVHAPFPGGGCRFGADPSRGVVDAQHRVYGFDNLFVADSSVFPSPVGVDPGLTIMAFSLLAADGIANTA